MNLFETVKTAVNAREAAQLYGVAVNRCGMALLRRTSPRRNPSAKN